MLVTFVVSTLSRVGRALADASRCRLLIGRLDASAYSAVLVRPVNHQGVCLASDGAPYTEVGR